MLVQDFFVLLHLDSSYSAATEQKSSIGVGMKLMTAEEKKIIQMIRETGRKVVPPGGQIWLYGSRARGDAHEVYEEIEVMRQAGKWNGAANRIYYSVIKTYDINKD